VLLGISGILLASSVYDGGVVEWTMTGLAMALGLLSLTSGLAAARGPRIVDAEALERWTPAAAPRLGDMLMSYGLITQEDLDRALAYQKGTDKRLGQVLVELNLVSHADLAQVLEEQLSRREGRLVWGAGARLVT